MAYELSSSVANGNIVATKVESPTNLSEKRNIMV